MSVRNGRRVLEHDEVDCVGPEATAGVGYQIEPLPPARGRVQPLAKDDGEIHV